MATGAFLVAFGVTPAEAVVYVWQHPPAWLMSGWTRLGILIGGIALIAAAVRFNIWSLRQRAIDELAEEMSWAIHHLLNRERPDVTHPQAQLTDYVNTWESDYRAWCGRVSGLLENRAYFTRADQLHFDRLGFVEPVMMTGNNHLDWLLGQLRLKFERLRDIINWLQQRSR